MSDQALEGRRERLALTGELPSTRLSALERLGSRVESTIVQVEPAPHLHLGGAGALELGDRCRQTLLGRLQRGIGGLRRRHRLRQRSSRRPTR